MARTALAIGGGLVGGIIGGSLGASAGFTLGNLLGGIFFGDDEAQGPTITGPRLNDTTVTTSTYGKGIPITFGSVRVGGNMFWATDIVEVRTEETVQPEGSAGGGKGQPSPPTQTRITFSYFGNFAMGFGEGEGFVRRIWADGKLIVDLSDEFAPGASRTWKYGGEHYRIYTGTETQLPDSLMEADKGVGNVPGHRGLIYVMFDLLPLADFGNRIPQISAEIVKGGATEFISINDNVNPGGGLFGRDSDYFDRSGRTNLGYNDNTNFLTVYSRLTRQQVDRVDPRDIQPVTAAATAAGLDIITFDLDFNNGKTAVDPEKGMLGMALDAGGNGGVAMHIGMLREPVPEDAVSDLRTGTYQFVRPSTLARYELHRVYKVGGARYFFGSAGLIDHVRLEATPFISFNQGDEFNPDIVEIVKTDAAISGSSTNFNGLAVPDDTVTAAAPGGAGDDKWMSAAYDPVNERVWFLAQEANEIVEFVGPSFGTLTDLNTILDPLHTSAGSFFLHGIAYDIVNDVIVVVADDDHFTIDPVTYAVIGFAGPNTTNPITDAGLAGHSPGFTENLWDNQETVERFFHELVDVNDLARWTTDDLTTPVIRHPKTSFTGDAWQPDNGVIWDGLISGYYTTLNDGTWGFPDRLKKSGVLLSTIVDALVSRTGVLTNADTDTTALTDIVPGYLIENPGTIRSMIEPTQQAYFYDGAEIDGKLKFKKRDGASFQTILSTELGAKVSGQDKQQLLDEPRKQETEVPRQVDVSYMNTNNDYQIGTQRDQRIQSIPNLAFAGITRGKHTAELRLPIVLSDQEARDIASKALASAWVERTSLEFTLPPKFMRLDPTDIITVQKISSFLTADIQIRITQIEFGAGGVLNVQGLLTDSAIFQANVTAQNIAGIPAGAIPFPVGTNLFLLNMPNLLGNEDNDGRAWWAAAPKLGVPNPAWRGSVLFRSLTVDGSQTVVDTTVLQTKWGVLTTSFGPPPDNGGGRNFTTRERTQTMTVTLQVTGTLSSITDLELFDGGNFAFIPATGELLQFQDAVLNASGNYVIDTFLRGRLGTEVFVAGTDGFSAATAPANSEIIFLGDLSSFQRFSDANERGLTRFYEATTLGGQLGELGNDQETFVNDSTSSIPLSPSDFDGTRDGGDNIDLVWKRRDRVNAELLDLVDVPLNEQGEEYVVDVVDRPDENAVVLRTLPNVFAASDQYDIADQQADVLHSGDFPFTLTGNLQNPSFEDGAVAIAEADPPTIPGWPTGTNGVSSHLGTWGTASSLGSIASAQAGTFFMFTTDIAPNEVFNTSSKVLMDNITPTPLNLTELDTNEGRFQITVNGFSAQGDVGGLLVETRIQVRFQDKDGAFISSATGTASAHSVAGTWEARSVGPVNIPPNSRSFTVRLYSNDVIDTNDIQIGWDNLSLSLTDTASGTVQRFAFDAFQISATTGRGRGRRTVAPPVGQ